MNWKFQLSIFHRSLLTAISIAFFVTSTSASNIQLLISGDGRGDLAPQISEHSRFAYGGLAERATAIEEFRKENNSDDVLLLEAGNFLFGNSRGEASCDPIVEAYSTMEYDAVNVSVADFRMGKAFTQELLKVAKLPVVSTNLCDATNLKPLFNPFLLVKKSGATTAILGLAEPPNDRILDFLPHLKSQLQGIHLQPIAEALDQWLPKVKGKADHIVVLYAGSSVGLQKVRQITKGKVDVIASAGATLLSARLTGMKPLMVSPLPQGREMATVLLSANSQGISRSYYFPITSEFSSDDNVKALLPKNLKRATTSEAASHSIVPLLEEAPKSLPLKPERNRFYNLQATMQNRGADIRIQSAGLFDSFGKLKAKEGKVLLVLRSQWENTIPLILRRNQGLATTYLIPHLGNHLYAIVNGKHLSRVYVSEAFPLPGQLPVKPLSLAYLGMQEEGNIVFEIEEEEMSSIDLRMYDYAHGHAQYELLGERPDAEKPIQPLKKNEVLEAGLYEFSKSDHIGSVQAKKGMVFVTLDFRATSQFVIDGDATAFDPHAEAGTRIDIGTVADWLEADIYNHLLVDGKYGYRPRQDLSHFGANPRFLPDLKTGNRLVFEVPENYRTLELRADFPNAKLPDGELIRPTPIRFELEGDTIVSSAEDPVWQVTDDTLKLSITNQEQIQEFNGTKADPNKSFLIFDVDLEGIGEKPEFFQAKRQLIAYNADGGIIEPHAITFDGIYHPYENVWVPNGEHRAFQLVFEVDTDASELRFGYHGYALAENFVLTADGAKKISSETAPESTLAQAPESSNTETSTVSEEDSERATTSTMDELEMIEQEKPEAPRAVLIPYKLAETGNKQDQTLADFHKRSDAVRQAGGFLPMPVFSYEDLGNQYTPQNNDLELGNDEDGYPIPTPIEFNQAYEGISTKEDEDIYTFEIKEHNPDQVIHFYAAFEKSEEAKQFNWSLRNPDNNVIVRTRFNEPCAWYDFDLEPGTYKLEFENNYSQPNVNYRFLVQTAEKVEHQETEWNDRNEYADPIQFGQTYTGRLFPFDGADRFLLKVDDSHQGKEYSLEVTTDNPENDIELYIYQKATGERVRDAEGSSGQLFVGNFAPAPGEYILLFEPDRHPVSYKFTIREQGTINPIVEREPNDVYGTKSLTVIEKFDQPEAEITGQFDGYETDTFAINVKDSNRLYTLSLAGDDVDRILLMSSKGREIIDSDRTKESAPALIDLKLPLGLHRFIVRGRACDWAVNIETSAIPEGYFEVEPNNNQSHATPLALGETHYGRLIDNWDYDYYKLVVHQAMNYRIRIKLPEGQKGFLRIDMPEGLSADYDILDEVQELDETKYLLPGHYFMYLQARQPNLDFYEFSISPDFDAGNDSEQLQCNFDFDQSTVAAHSDLIQLVEGNLSITNTSDSVVSGNIQFQTSHDNVSVQTSDSRVTLEPHESKTLPVQLTIAAETWSRSKVFIHASLKTNDQVFNGAQCALVFDENMLPVGTEKVRQSNLLPELVGGMNLGAKMLGATCIVETEESYPWDDYIPEENRILTLMDGVVENDSFYGYRAIIKLAGDGTIPLTGTSFELHGEGSLWRSAKDFKIELSDEGEVWESYFSGTLDGKKGLQQFVFPSPKPAQYARLTLLNTQFVEETPHLGEWRIIGKSGKSITEQPYDILNENFGGHLIHSSKNYGVYGFHHDRAAKITALGLENSYQRIENPKTIKLSISMNSPVGPWKELGVFDVSAANEMEPWQTRVEFEEPTWARFVKAEWESFSGHKEYPPHKLSLYEQKHDEDYYSIFAEWGENYIPAGYEHSHPRAFQKVSRVQSSKSTPYQLTKGEASTSAVSINQQWEDWFTIPAQDSDKRIQLDLSALPFIKFEIDITDENGEAIDTTIKSDGISDRTYLFAAEAGKSYRVHIYEPRRSIVFLWDVSGSMSSFVPSIENAIQSFAQAVNPNTEIVHLLPFEEDPGPRFLLEDWADEPYLLTDTVRYYDPPDSSYAHLNLLAATEKLKDQKGTRAAIVITDCESSRDCNPDLWQKLKEVRPVVFTFQTSDRTSYYTTEQDDMQDWSAVGGGFYRSTKDASELDVAFEKVKVFLRRPAPYSIKFETPELLPGSIQIVDARAEETIVKPEEDGVLLLIDASASMREKLPDGAMKVSAAKKVIEKMVTEYLPPEINFGLRVFGHRGGENCKSELMLPLEPINAETVKQKLLFMRSSSLGNTSLAEGISWAEKDFEGIEGNKRLVVLTDGEETCQGDPAAEIAKLSDAGLEVMVNIVGFTLGDESTKSDYENWVQSTNGSYYDAQDSEALGLALQKAMTPTQLPKFKIIDEQGHSVASGTVGDAAIELKSAKYVVQILREEGVEEHRVQVIENDVKIDYK